MSVAELPWNVPGRIHGVDASACQRELSGAALIAAGCRFLIAKSSEGVSGVDPMFNTHIATAKAAKLKAGSYHFIHSTESGVIQAERYWGRIEHANLDMRPIGDWEDTHRVNAGGSQQAVDTACAFFDRIKTLSGRRGVLYTFPSFLAALRGVPGLEKLLDVDLWISHFRWDPNTGRDYGTLKPNIPGPYTDAKAWQCGGNMCPRILGIDQDLDRNVFFGDEAAFDAWNLDAPVREVGLVLGNDGPVHDPYWVDRMAATLSEDPDDPSETVTSPGTPTAKSNPALRAVNAPILKDQ